MKKQILIASYPLNAGGTTTSLISLLHNIDYKSYEVDLILLRQKGEFLQHIPSQVNLLEPALLEGSNLKDKLYKLVNYTLKGIFIKKLMYLIKKKPYSLGIFQIMSGYGWASVSRGLKKQYDVAIGFMEGWPNIYVSKKVRANKKIAWVHPDYKNSGLDPSLDAPIFKCFNKIVLVSQSCKNSFDQGFSQYTDKTIVIENIVSVEHVKRMAEAEVDDFIIEDGCLNIITAARLRNSDKGLDRAVKALKRLKADGYKIRWYVLGEGEDRQLLEDMIREYGLEKDFILMGQRSNPYPYIKRADLYALTSRYEGKPISVTEAQVLGVGVVTTKYISANEQIDDGVDGIIVENNDEAIYDGIKRILDNPELLNIFSENLKNKTIGNADEINKLYEAMKN